MSTKLPREIAGPARCCRAMAAATAFLALAGCANVQQPSGAASTDLTGTAWRLASFQAAQAGSKPLQPSRPDQFWLQFDTGARVFARLDCNRGTGSWQAGTGTDGGATLRIGPLATTRMMCPPSPFSATLPADLESIRRYRVDGDRLHIEAGAGVYTWERAARQEQP